MRKPTAILLISSMIIALSAFIFTVSWNAAKDASHMTIVAVEDLPEAPALPAESSSTSNEPVYFFLFTHTEDPFNHELYEERYRRTGALLEQLQDEYPREDLTWTIQFQGSDANAISERNASTGLADYLQNLAENGLVQFGYHAHHDATYQNRPQNDLPKHPTWNQVYDAIYTWLSCKKDIEQGGCVEESGGGIPAVEDIFGPVQVVSGVGAGEGALIERSAGSEAIKDLLPDRMLGFGFPDHGSTLSEESYTEARNDLMALLTPTQQTSSATFFMDNAVRINDGVPLDNAASLNLIKGPEFVEQQLESVDRGRSHIFNAGIASKYIYTEIRTSPTRWGYANPEDPQLPSHLRVSESKKERNYAFEEASMRYLLHDFLAANPESKFVTADDIPKLFTSEDYEMVNEEELTQIAAWLVHHWNDQPPAYAFDGEDFYSLADSFALLSGALSEMEDNRVLINTWYGPWEGSQKRTREVFLSESEITKAVKNIQGPEIEGVYKVGKQKITSAQLLYAMAYVYLLEQDDENLWTHIQIPATAQAPESFDLLSNLGCADCYDTSWSLKPARFQD